MSVLSSSCGLQRLVGGVKGDGGGDLAGVWILVALKPLVGLLEEAGVTQTEAGVESISGVDAIGVHRAGNDRQLTIDVPNIEPGGLLVDGRQLLQDGREIRIGGCDTGRRRKGVEVSVGGGDGVTSSVSSTVVTTVGLACRSGVCVGASAI